MRYVEEYTRRFLLSDGRIDKTLKNGDMIRHYKGRIERCKFTDKRMIGWYVSDSRYLRWKHRLPLRKMNHDRLKITSNRDRLIMAYRDNGMTFAELGRKFGISRQRAHSIYKKNTQHKK